VAPFARIPIGRSRRPPNRTTNKQAGIFAPIAPPIRSRYNARGSTRPAEYKPLALQTQGTARLLIMEALSCVEISPDVTPEAAIIWLHGLGADGHDFAPLVPQLQSRLPIPTRFLLPHAPHRPVTVNGGYVMRAWYDIVAFDLSQAEDADGIHASARQIDALIERELHEGISARRIALAGFSQGGAIALHTGLRYPRRLCGILAMSTYLPLATTLAAEATSSNRDIPIFMGHGTADTVVAVDHALASARLLRELGYPVEWHSYDMPHGLCEQEIDDLAAWLARILTG
jgi:phospholipase/carboxylesterase